MSDSEESVAAARRLLGEKKRRSSFQKNMKNALVEPFFLLGLVPKMRENTRPTQFKTDKKFRFRHSKWCDFESNSSTSLEQPMAGIVEIEETRRDEIVLSLVEAQRQKKP